MKTNYNSPVGNIVITYSEKKIISVLKQKKVKTLDKLSQPAQELIQCFEDYFAGNLQKLYKFPVSKLELNGTEFQKKVWKELKKIKPDQTSNYSKLAEKVKSPKAYRAVGSAVGKNPFFILLPCHRVLGKNKTLCGFAYGTSVKKKLLVHEDLEFIA